MKGRKGKKGGKAAAKNNGNANQQTQNPPSNQKYDQPLDNGQLDNQGEEYYDDEFDDTPSQAPAPHAAAGPNGNYVNNQAPAPNPKATQNARGDGKASVNGA